MPTVVIVGVVRVVRIRVAVVVEVVDGSVVVEAVVVVDDVVGGSIVSVVGSVNVIAPLLALCGSAVTVTTAW